MRTALALVLAFAADPAQAHCYSRWYYPWPQSCRSKPTPHRLWIVETPAPTPPPAPDNVPDENSERAQAIETLRVELRKTEALKLELRDIGTSRMEEQHAN